MKRIAVFAITLAFVLGFSSCRHRYDIDYDDDAYSGTYPVQKPVGTQAYMESIVTGYLADHLWVMERALKYDAAKIYETVPKSAEYDTGGKSLWQVGTVWTASEVKALNGISIKKAQEDSTWVLNRNNEASIKNLPSCSTDSEVTLRMLPTAAGAPRHEWSLSVQKLVRTEEYGYKAFFSTKEAAEFRVAESESSWSYCKGTFWMDVTKDDAPVDKAVLAYSGDPASAIFYHGL